MSKLSNGLATVAAALSLATLTAPAEGAQHRQGHMDQPTRAANPDWKLGRGNTVNGVTNILSGPAMAFYVKDAKNFTKMFNDPNYQAFIAAHPELKINNPYADPVVAKHLSDFQQLMDKDPSVVKKDLPAWDTKCEIISNASAKHLAHFINIALVKKGLEPFNFGTDGAKMRGTVQGDWMDGTFGAFLKTDAAKTLTFMTSQGEKSIRDLYIGWCRAQLAQVQSETNQPKIPTPVRTGAPGIETEPHTPGNRKFGLPNVTSETTKPGQDLCIIPLSGINEPVYGGQRTGQSWGGGFGFFLPGTSGGGSTVPCPVGCFN